MPSCRRRCPRPRARRTRHRPPSLRAPLLLFAILRNGLLEMPVVRLDRWELMGVAILRNGLTPRPARFLLCLREGQCQSQ